jgi:NAD(P)H-dependent FMN reductase
MTKLNIPVILGTAREGRYSEKVANFIKEQSKIFGFETILIDVKDYSPNRTIPTWEENPHINDFKESIKNADGYIIVLPEYNRGYPGELKLFFDAFYKEYRRKPVAFCGVSDGPMGGSRAVEMFRIVCMGAEMVPVKSAVYFSMVDKLFDENGKILDENFERRANDMFKDLEWFAAALKPAREKAM